jgi:hypothetical protein
VIKPAAHPNPGPPSLHTTTIIIAAAAILSICMGIRQCMGLFLPPIRADIGLSASQWTANHGVVPICHGI